MLNGVAPFFIVDDLAKTLEFYQDRLGFSVLYKGGDESTDFWAMLGRDHVMLMFKAITPDIHPQHRTDLTASIVFQAPGAVVARRGLRPHHD